MKAQSLFVAGLLVVVHPTAQRLTYAPELNASVTKRVTLALTAELDGISLTIGGEGWSGFLSGVQAQFEGSVSYLVTDELLALGEGRPRRLRRSFDGISGATVLRIDGAATETRLVSDLEGAAILVAWNDEQQAFDTVYEDVLADNRPESLEGLDEDMSLRALLPPVVLGELEQGASWKIPFDDLLRVALPGGYLALVPEETGEFDPLVLEDLLESMLEAVREQFSDWASGHATATYAGKREAEYADENELDVIALDLRVELDADLTPLLRKLADEWATRTGSRDESDIGEISGAALEFLLEGRGELTWDRVAGHLQGFVFLGTQESRFSLRVDDPEGSGRLALELELHGTVASTIALE